MTRALIVNADDFGRTHGINRGVVLAHENGIVTSASAMVRWPGAEEAAELARAHPLLSVGLHTDLSEWTYSAGEWSASYEVVVGDDAAAVAAEVDAQLARFVSLFGRQPTHLDSHQHVHRDEPLRSVLIEAGRKLAIPVRDLTPGIDYRGDFYGQTAKGEPLPDAIALESLLRVLSSLRPGVTELELRSRAAGGATGAVRSSCSGRCSGRGHRACVIPRAQRTSSLAGSPDVSGSPCRPFDQVIVVHSIERLTNALDSWVDGLSR